MITKTKLLSIGQASQRYRVPVVWLRDEADADRLPHLRVGRLILFSADALETELLRRAEQTEPREASAR